MMVMIGYIFMFKMVKKNEKFRFRNSSWVNTSFKCFSVDEQHALFYLALTQYEQSILYFY